MVVESQARLITSNNVLLQVIQQHRASTRIRNSAASPRESWRRLLGLVGIASAGRRRNQARTDGGAGRPEPPRHRQEDRPQLHRRYRRLVARPGEGGDARQRARPRLSDGIQEFAGHRRAARDQGFVRPAHGIEATASQRRKRTCDLQGAEQFRRHPGHADQRSAAFRQQPAARRGAGCDARRAGQIRPDRGEPSRHRRQRRYSRRHCSRRPSPICARNMPKPASAMRN